MSIRLNAPIAVTVPAEPPNDQAGAPGDGSLLFDLTDATEYRSFDVAVAMTYRIKTWQLEGTIHTIRTTAPAFDVSCSYSETITATKLGGATSPPRNDEGDFAASSTEDTPGTASELAAFQSAAGGFRILTGAGGQRNIGYFQIFFTRADNDGAHVFPAVVQRASAAVFNVSDYVVVGTITFIVPGWNGEATHSCAFDLYSESPTYLGIDITTTASFTATAVTSYGYDGVWDETTSENLLDPVAASA